MKQLFLNSLIGLDGKHAQALAGKQGFETITLTKNEAIALCAYANTVILCVDDNGIVSSAEAGDPLKLIKD